MILSKTKPSNISLDSDREDLRQETLEKQYKIVKAHTSQSTVSQFGDLDIALKFMVADFQGRKENAQVFDKDAPAKWDACINDTVPAGDGKISGFILDFALCMYYLLIF